ncbi:MAG: hypothetical protein JWO49_2696 [Arthrobacter sp.]|nr:hypothetical protein [Arthrobacter sp.]
MQPYGPLRLLRSLILTGVIVGLAAGAHLAGGGSLPAPIITVALTALLLVPVIWLSRRQFSFAMLLGLLGTGQLVLHEAFSTLSARALCRPPLAGPVSHHTEAASRICLPADPAGMNTHVGVGVDPLAMPAGHMLAVLATAWFLRQGEAALWQLLAWLSPLVTVLRPVVILVAGPRTFAREPNSIPAPWRNLPVNSRRGPPAASLLRAMPR